MKELMLGDMWADWLAKTLRSGDEGCCGRRTEVLWSGCARTEDAVWGPGDGKCSRAPPCTSLALLLCWK